MEPRKDFETFYAEKVVPKLEALRIENRTVRFWLVAMLLTPIPAIALLVEGAGGWATMFFIFFAAAVYFYTSSKEKYADHFKETIINEIIHFICPGITYLPDKHVPSKEYKASGLYRRRIDYYDGEDSLMGVYKQVSFHCSELHTQYDFVRNRQRTAFKGLFFVAAVNGAYTGGTYIWSKGVSQLGATVADERYRLMPFPKVYAVKTTNAGFAKEFTVCSTHPGQAGSILTESFMNCMLKFKKQIERDISLSVVGGRCFVSIPINENLFEPSGDPGNKENIKEYFFEVLMVLSIINQLELYKLC